jgi:predicted HTH transcriptional regulator
MRIEELRDLIARGESSTLELKASVPRPDVIARHLAAMANTSGGTLVLGVREPTNAVGVNGPRARQTVERAFGLLAPSPRVRIEEHSLDGKTVLSINVSASQSLVAADGGYYRKAGEVARPLSAIEIQEHLSATPPEGALKDLAESVAKQTVTIEKLRTAFDDANSTWRKLAIAGGGAIVGALLKYALDWYLHSGA